MEIGKQTTRQQGIQGATEKQTAQEMMYIALDMRGEKREKPVVTVEIDYWRCELHDSLEFCATEDSFKLLLRVIEKGGAHVVAKELPKPAVYFNDAGRHRLMAVLKSVHDIQGLEFHEGTDALQAIESLVVKYAELKQ